MDYHIFMAFQHPLKIECDKAANLINELHKNYQAYFMGEERQPPLPKRKQLDELIVRLRAQVQAANQSAVKFMYKQIEARYAMYKNKWDKKMAEIENGTYRIPIKKPNFPRKKIAAGDAAGNDGAFDLTEGTPSPPKPPKPGGGNQGSGSQGGGNQPPPIV